MKATMRSLFATLPLFSLLSELATSFSFGSRRLHLFPADRGQKRRGTVRRRERTETVLEVEQNSLERSNKSPVQAPIFDGVNLYSVRPFLKKHMDAPYRVCAVYSVADASRKVRYVSWSSDAASAVFDHFSYTPEGTVEFVRLKTLTEGSRSSIEANRLVREWLSELPYVPEGNDDVEGGMKFFSRAGMRDKVIQEVEEEERDREAAERKTEGKEVSRSQAEKITSADGQGSAPAWEEEKKQNTQTLTSPPIVPTVSPFALREETPPLQGKPSPDSDASSPPPPPLTLAEVDAALDIVRPFLVGDGGNVRVLSVDLRGGPLGGARVEVELQGACSGCSASETTMSLGIEQHLRSVWPWIEEVVKIETDAASLNPRELTDELIRSQLSDIDWGLKQMDAQVAVEGTDAERGEVRLRYRGPEPSRMIIGIEMLLSERISGELLKRIEWVSVVDSQSGLDLLSLSPSGEETKTETSSAGKKEEEFPR
uniref:NIF system FeS cluster assembly NifU C-terminal domain-containing protein n=1 Tax=Chromera velia CCMP2878 TaxID=1169474 RepID=A0A0G4ICB3_9ALVE|eukprot:Cvel_13098.t1-p1 / transcript=Cvel_13098.t1 / gene=Cvel_13098 / organism=Chromera_velia_CCMP2878 / gene_product=NifU-like protein 1, chloroplastic, putative / transcript_product=NifU-like protein 1, chloroplastic, putative / location=Cvel_scaffold882:45255-49717(-) / protein_length=483 / sequence_SO=supercontig / SO=protein_coding / is_pseudo=false